MSQDLLTTSQAARILGISRIAVYKRIKRGDLPATRVGRNYLVQRSALVGKLILTAEDRRLLDAAVRRTVREYGETLRLLGQE